MKQNSLFSALLISYSLLIFGCGGGGGGSETPSGGGGPIVQPPPATVTFTPKLVQYEGLRSPFEITDANIGETAVSALGALDFLNQIVLGEEFSNSFTITQVTNTPLASEDLVCSSGTGITQTNAQQTQSTTTYNNCVADGDRINGEIQSFIVNTADGERPTINIALSVFTIEDNSTLSIEGHIAVTENGNLQYQLLLTDEEDTVWFDNLIAFVDPIGLRVFFQGEMYVSTQGKLTITTNSIEYSNDELSYVADIDLIGDRTINVNVVQGKLLLISGPTLATSLSLDLSDYAGLPEDNQAPQARATFESSALYNEIISLDGSSSSDPNLQVLTFAWEVIKQVEEAVVSIDAQNGLANVSANRPGEYTIRMTTLDPLGQSDFLDIDLSFSPRPPEGSFAFGAQQYTYTSQLTGAALVTSPDFDGPFSFSLEYSPEEMQIDDTGNISWTVNLPNFGQPLEVRAGVRVTSPSHSKVFHASFEAVPQRSVKRIPINTSFDSHSKFALDTTTPVFLNNRSAFNASFEDATMALSPHPLPESMIRYAASIVHMADIDEDGDIDYFVTQFIEQTLTHQIFSIDALGNRAFYYEFTKSNDPDFVVDVEIMELSDQPKREVALVDRNSRDFFQVLSNTGELLTNQGYLQTPWCDVDGDGNIDWQTDLNYRLFNEAQSIEFSAPAVSQITQPRNRSIDGECILYAQTIGDDGLPANIVELTPLADASTSREKVIANVADLASEAGIDSYFSILLTEFNADNDEENELLVEFFTNEASPALLIDNVGEENQIVKILTSDQDSTATFGLGGFSTQIFDINDDGVDEFFDFRMLNFRSDGNILAFFIEGSTISEFMNARTYSAFSSEVEYYNGTRGAIGSLSDRLVAIEVTNDSATQTELVEDINYGSLVSEEASQRFVYTLNNNPNSGDFELLKRTLSGSIVYQTRIVESGANINLVIEDLNDEYLLVSDFNPMIVAKSTGEVVYQFGERTRAIAANNNEYLLPSSNPERVGFVLAYNEQDNALEVVALSSDLTFEDFPITGLDELLQTPAERISLIQLDETPKRELVIQIGMFENRQALLIDLDEGTIEEIEKSINGNSQYPDDTLSLLSPCIVNSQTCQNSIYGQSLSTFGLYGNIYSADTLTGETVWRTKQAFLGLRSIKIVSDGGMYKSLVITENDWFTLE